MIEEKNPEDITARSCDMEGHAQKCVERCCELAHQTVDQPHKVFHTLCRRSPSKTRRYGHGGRVVRLGCGSRPFFFCQKKKEHRSVTTKILLPDMFLRCDTKNRRSRNVDGYRFCATRRKKRDRALGLPNVAKNKHTI